MNVITDISCSTALNFLNEVPSTVFYRTINILPFRLQAVISGAVLTGSLTRLYCTMSREVVCIYPSGVLHEGDFVDAKSQGKGVYRFADGTQYEGDFVDGKFHGKGVYRLVSGSQYEGDFVNGKFHGKGIFRFASGSQYEGDFVDDRFHGKGIFRYPKGSQYEGDFVAGKFHGKGVYREVDGLEFIGEWANDKRRGCLKDKLFFFLLFGIKGGSVSQGYSLRIVSDYLLRYFADDKKMIESVVNPLIEAANFCEIDPEKMNEKLCEIVAGLKSGRSYLLPYGHLGHATLLNLVPTPDGKFIDCEIYNSGDGIRFHEFDEGSRKYQLMKKYRISIEQLSVSQLKKLANNNQFEDAVQSYHAISSIDGAEIIQLPPEEKIWKKPQVSDNCENKCVSTVLAYKIPHVYKQVRRAMFQDCLNAVEDLTGLDAKGLARVEHKIKKLNLVRPERYSLQGAK